jgi:hypothetical protein
MVAAMGSNFYRGNHMLWAVMGWAAPIGWILSMWAKMGSQGVRRRLTGHSNGESYTPTWSVYTECRTPPLTFWAGPYLASILLLPDLSR